MKASHSTKRAPGHSSAKGPKGIKDIKGAQGGGQPSKKDMILELARALGKARLAAPEIAQIRRQLITRLGEAGKTSSDYILSVLEDAD